MAKLKRDERLCPFCAETIKAAAIRCRYCQAELPPVEPEAETTEPAEATPEDDVVSRPTLSAPQPPVDEAPQAPPTDDESVPFLASRRLTAILAVLAVLAAAGVGIAWVQAADSSAISAPDGTLVGDAPRSEAVVAGADLTQRALSYDYRTLPNDMEIARARMTPEFRKQYNNTMAAVRANTLKNKIVLQADVVSSAIIAATEHRARLLVFINQTTSAQATDAQQLDRNSLVVTLVRGQGDWMLSDLTALG
jgi:hypothetical protein